MQLFIPDAPEWEAEASFGHLIFSSSKKSSPRLSCSRVSGEFLGLGFVCGLDRVLSSVPDL